MSLRFRLTLQLRPLLSSWHPILTSCWWGDRLTELRSVGRLARKRLSSTVYSPRFQRSNNRAKRENHSFKLWSMFPLPTLSLFTFTSEIAIIECLIIWNPNFRSGSTNPDPNVPRGSDAGVVGGILNYLVKLNNQTERSVCL